MTIIHRFLAHIVQGFLMGGADIIPGVSGGTVALILGIYERLISAISQVDRRFIRLIFSRRWSDAFDHIDGRFVLPLAVGIVTGIGGLASLIHYLLNEHLQPTYALFSGLIFGSSLIVGRNAGRWTAGSSVLFFPAVAAGWFLVGLPFLEMPPQGLWYIFFCGTVGICAMILPGISGAFLLLVLGKYGDITGTLRNVIHGDITTANVLLIAVFCCGCLTGLLSFSRLLRWLLERRRTETYTALCGLMVGALRKLWPFKRDLTPDIDEFGLKQFANVWPDQFAGGEWLAFGLFGAGLIAVLLLDSRRHGVSTSASDR